MSEARYTALITMTIVDEQTGQLACEEQYVFVWFDPPVDPRETLSRKALEAGCFALADAEDHFKTKGGR